MASTVLPFLLLMSSSFLISSVSGSPETSKKMKEDFKAIGRFLHENVDTISSTVKPFLEMIPVFGELIGIFFNLVGLLKKDEMKAVMNEFKNLNSKLDRYHAEQKWDSWASGAYYKPEKDIKVAWEKFTTLLHGLLEANDDLRKKLKSEFEAAYLKYEPAIQNLHKLLTAKGITFINPLGDNLAEKLNCHEMNIIQYTKLINILIFKGITMNQFYYKLKNTETEAKVHQEAKIAYDAASVMFQIHINCINRSMEFTKKDVEMLIDKTTKRSELAKKVHLFLEEVYDRYDWMVVAFRTKKSHRKIIEAMNHHVLTGFTEVIKDDISVAVARQVKGTHTKTADVKKAIEKCIKKSVMCYQVAKKLKECSETVESKPVNQTYTAVHAYLRKAHDSHNAHEAPDEDLEVNAAPEDSSTPYIYTGKCEGFSDSKFVVLIKSDEEIMTKDPCSKMNCGGQNGKCVEVKDTFLAVCQCNDKYYGKQCEYSLEDYKRMLLGKSEIQVMDSRGRIGGSRQ